MILLEKASIYYVYVGYEGDLFHVTVVSYFTNFKTYFSLTQNQKHMQTHNFDPSPKESATVLEELTCQEIKVLKLVADGLTNQEIAKTLFIAETTVKTHRRNITRKANVKGKSQIRRFIRWVRSLLKNTTIILPK